VGTALHYQWARRYIKDFKCSATTLWVTGEHILVHDLFNRDKRSVLRVHFYFTFLVYVSFNSEGVSGILKFHTFLHIIQPVRLTNFENQRNIKQQYHTRGPDGTEGVYNHCARVRLTVYI
jgi:hypothetical protein